MNKAQRITILITGITLALANILLIAPIYYSEYQGTRHHYSMLDVDRGAILPMFVAIIILGASFFFFFWKRKNNK